MEGPFHFGEKFAYKHKQISPFYYGSKETVHEDFKTLKEEVNCLKETIKILIENIDEEELLKKSLEEIKAEIRILAASNRYIQEQAEVDLLDEDSNIESVSDDVKESYVDETKKTTIEY